VDAEEAKRQYGLRVQPWTELTELDALVLAVPHRSLLAMPRHELLSPIKLGGILIDVKSAIDPRGLPPSINYWSL
jgi:UDP-N-acetyl-D-galactosamine dehydrogenase